MVKTQVKRLRQQPSPAQKPIPACHFQRRNLEVTISLSIHRAAHKPILIRDIQANLHDFHSPLLQKRARRWKHFNNDRKCGSAKLKHINRPHHHQLHPRTNQSNNIIVVSTQNPFTINSQSTRPDRNIWKNQNEFKYSQKNPNASLRVLSQDFPWMAKKWPRFERNDHNLLSVIET